MRRPHSAIVFVVSLAFALVAAAFAVTPAAAGSPSITLYGSRAGGWGYTNTSLSIPGPPLTVTKGDNVTLYLNGTDAHNHAWYIDYNNNSHADANEPTSPTFNSVQIKWNFTASQNGTYVYRSSVGADVNMWGNITINNPGTTPPPILAGDNTVLIVVGVVIIIIAVLAVGAMFFRRKNPPPPQS